jgi:periplasmic protein TonB
MQRLRLTALALLMAVAAVASPRAQDQTVHRPGDGVTTPVVVKSVKPEYTRDALQLGIQGTVLLSAVVLADGTIGEVAVVRSLDREFGLDQAAIDAMKQWEFKAGTKDGKAVAVRIECELRFALK